MTPQDATQQTWDVIIIGAGMGGGMAARRLTQNGQSVLIVEKGPRGHAKEEQGTNGKLRDPVARQVRGVWPTPFDATINGRTTRTMHSIGSGVGGSSVFYAGALERPERHDLESTLSMPHPTGGWPVGYDAYVPYFQEAEQLLELSGGHDPLSAEHPAKLRTPRAIGVGEQKMMDQMVADGLHPYRLPLAIRDVPGCMVCIGHKCPRNCKMDGRSAGIEPALESGLATLLTDCEVSQIHYDDVTVCGISVVYGGETFRLNARDYVLAAGAFGSPRLLLKSTEYNSDGCANSSDWVGRGLMFHLNEMFVLWPNRRHRFDGASKAISLRDLYSIEGNRIGLVQSMGLEASFGNIAQFLATLYDRSFMRRFQKLRFLTNFPALIAARYLGQAKVFSVILEDLPYPENRVVLNPSDPDIPAYQYTIPQELHRRWQLCRRQIKKSFRSHRSMLLGFAPQLNHGHPCGTLRFGSDPKTSVLDANCKTHDLDNLYVADSSFFPTSMGVNPSLTIAANALRVADVISRSQSQEPK